MDQITAGDSSIKLPTQIAHQPLVCRIIDFYPADTRLLLPRARVMFAKNPHKLSSYQAKRAAGQFLLHHLLCSISSLQKQAWELRYTEAGAPELACTGGQDLCISLARSGNWLAAAVAEKANIGIDVERIRPRSNLAEKAEFLNWNVPIKNISDFYANWTLWEASAKCVQGSVLMGKNPGFEMLRGVDTYQRPGTSGQWSGLHDSIDKKVFIAIVMRSENSVDLNHKILNPDECYPWPG